MSNCYAALFIVKYSAFMINSSSLVRVCFAISSLTILPNSWLSYPFTPEKICDEIKDTLNCVSSDEQFSAGDVEINVPGYRITGGPSLTAGEIKVLRALLNGESITANDGVYINALNTKFGKIGTETRIKYKAKKGFELVAQNE